MKRLLVIFLFPLYAFTQTYPDTCFTTQELNDISNTIDSLWQVDEINTNIISNHNLSIYNKRYYIKIILSVLILTVLQTFKH